MPLIDTSRIHEVLEEAGVLPKTLDETAALHERMSAKGLGVDKLLSHLAGIVETGETDHVRLSAIEKALKMVGALKEQSTSNVSFTVVINDASHSGINPILIPRELTR